MNFQSSTHRDTCLNSIQFLQNPHLSISPWTHSHISSPNIIWTCLHLDHSNPAQWRASTCNISNDNCQWPDMHRFSESMAQDFHIPPDLGRRLQYLRNHTIHQWFHQVTCMVLFGHLNDSSRWRYTKSEDNGKYIYIYKCTAIQQDVISSCWLPQSWTWTSSWGPLNLALYGMQPAATSLTVDYRIPPSRVFQKKCLQVAAPIINLNKRFKSLNEKMSIFQFSK